jgi:DNA relaxase NicK
MNCNVLIDWLTFSVKGCVDPYTVISWYLGMDGSLFQEMPYGLNGYDRVLQFNDIMVCYAPRENSDFHDMGVCVSMSGNGCRTFETYSKLSLDGCTDTQGTVNTVFPALFQLICCNDCNVSRVDLACDDHDGVLSMSTIVDSCMANNLNTRMQKRQIVQSFDGTQNAGTTVYLGSPSSDFRVRIYDKAKEQGDFTSHWIRVELVMRGKNAMSFVENFVNCESVGTLASGIINEKFSFIERDDSNISRCSVCGWWLEFVGNLECIKLFSRELVTHAIEDIEDWVIRQIAPSLGLLFKAKGSLCLSEIAKDGIQRLSTKQLALLDDYKNVQRAAV